jgi:hypothetical protein
LYFLTDLDIWILSVELNLPIVLFSGTSLKILPHLQWLYLSGNVDDFSEPLYFLRSPANIISNHALTYSLIPNLKYNQLLGNIKDEMKNQDKKNMLPLREYIESIVII